MNKHSSPPKWATQFLRWFCSEELLEEIQGDLEEAFYHRKANHGKWKANLWYISDVFKFFKPYSFENYSRTKQFMPMLKNYVKVSIRNILKRKGFTAINMLGLSIGITAVMLVGLYIHHELTYDKQFPASENIYRLVNNYRDQTYTCMYFSDYYDSDFETQLTLIDKLKSYDGVVDACHFVPNTSAIGPSNKWYVYVDDREFVREDFLFTNTGIEFQKLFPQQFLIGSPENAFSKFNTVVLTESTAETFFGKEWRYFDLLSKDIRLSDETFSIGGVVADLPGNTHFDFGVIVHQRRIPSWGGYTYFKTEPNTSGETIAYQVNQDIESIYPGYTENVLSKGVGLVALTDVHFTDGMLYEIKPIANSQYLLIFGVVGLVILLIIWTNYSNLSIATYAGRQKELGVRKVMGARASDVAYQVMVEAILLTLLCFPIVLGLVYVFLPGLNGLLEVSIQDTIIFNPILIFIFLGVLVITGLISGLYPAIAFGQKSMLRLFDGKLGSGKAGQVFQFRRILLTTQFFMLIGLMSLAAIIMQQMHYISEKSLGFEKDGVVFFEVRGPEKYDQIKSLVETFPEVVAVGNGIIPGAEMYNQLTYQMKNTDEVLSDGTHLYTSIGSMEVLGIQSEAFNLLEKGKDSVFLINETAAKKLAAIKGVSPNELIGETLVMEPEWENEDWGYGIHYTIAAIIDDFDYFNLKYESQPLLLEVHTDPDWVYNMLLRVNTDNWIETVNKIEEAYLQVENERPFDLAFLDNYIDQQYKKERNAGKLASGLTIVCIILSVMGLVGIVGFITLSRQKEISVRKVFGASVPQILAFVSKEYLVMMAVATIVAIPAAIYLANQWLESFAYRIEPSFWVVIFSGLLTLVIVIIVVIAQSYKSANLNPSDTLRYE
ncbi:ABC transporter permease [Ekhidna sp.]|uniref:ABC transporter permease n=1 Tax=Ekhidna sp. TaxID=2608089 RepID=UPI003BAA0029